MNTPMVSYQGGSYSVPHTLLGETVWVWVHGAGRDERVVMAHVGDRGAIEVARHARPRSAPGGQVPRPGHRRLGRARRHRDHQPAGGRQPSQRLSPAGHRPTRCTRPGGQPMTTTATAPRTTHPRRRPRGAGHRPRATLGTRRGPLGVVHREVAGRDRSSLATRQARAAFPTGKTFHAWKPEASSIPTPMQQALRTLEWFAPQGEPRRLAPRGSPRSRCVWTMTSWSAVTWTVGGCRRATRLAIPWPTMRIAEPGRASAGTVISEEVDGP